MVLTNESSMKPLTIIGPPDGQIIGSTDQYRADVGSKNVMLAANEQETRCHE